MEGGRAAGVRMRGSKGTVRARKAVISNASVVSPGRPFPQGAHGFSRSPADPESRFAEDPRQFSCRGYSPTVSLRC